VKAIPKNVNYDMRGKASKYPWGAWLCGKSIQLEYGKDFDVSPQSMRCYLRQKANSIGYQCTIHIDKNDARNINIIPKDM